MSKIFNTIQKYQEISMRDGGIHFTKEGFTILHDEVMDGLDRAGKNGMIIGAVSTGMIFLGIEGYRQLRKRNFSNDNKKKDKKSKALEKRPFEVTIQSEDGTVDRVTISAYDELHAINQIRMILEDGQEVTDAIEL